MRHTGWLAFSGWALVGACCATTVAAAPSFGLFLLPVAALALGIARRTLRRWPEALGAGMGIGVLLLAIALVNRDYHACPSSGELMLAPGQHAVSCGGLNPVPFLILGLVLSSATALAFAALPGRSAR